MRWFDRYGWVIVGLAGLMMLAQLVRAFIKFVWL
jgi:uncharacterized membrane protein YuzA (DUF378 family)